MLLAYVIKTVTPSGEWAWVKRQAGVYRVGPREQAAVFPTKGEAGEVMRELPRHLPGLREMSIDQAELTDSA